MNGEKVTETAHVVDSLPVPLVGLVTPQRLLAAIGFTVDDARKGLVRTRQALNARTPIIRSQRSEYGGDPDHRIRLEAARMIYELAGLTSRKREDEADPGRPVAVQIIVHPPDAATQRGVTLTIGAPTAPPAQESLDLG